MNMTRYFNTLLNVCKLHSAILTRGGGTKKIQHIHRNKEFHKQVQEGHLKATHHCYIYTVIP